LAGVISSKRLCFSILFLQEQAHLRFFLALFPSARASGAVFPSPLLARRFPKPESPILVFSRSGRCSWTLSPLSRARGKDGGERAVIQDRIFSELYDGKIADLYENFSRANAREGCSFDRQRPLLREENNVLSVFGKIE
jgi:hypothetical protein